jgi:hypothetical protein
MTARNDIEAKTGPLRDIHRIHEERLAQAWVWSWTRHNGRRCHFIYDIPTGEMRFRVDHPNDGKRRRKDELMRQGFNSPQEAREFAWAMIRKDTHANAEVAHAGRFSRIG